MYIQNPQSLGALEQVVENYNQSL
ncbi:hypothetical protein [Effusibacillus dendaii]